MKKMIYDTQYDMFSRPRVIGYGDEDFFVKEIDRGIANDVISKNHYSRKYFNNSYIHLGVFIHSELLGVLQYGHLLNNNSVGKIVEGTKNGEALELNRMWIDDKAARNSESKAISYSIKYIKQNYPQINWIQSFADERCGGFGIVYQACSFNYYGEHISTFYTDGDNFYHNIQVTAKQDKAGIQVKDRDALEKRFLRQFRYIKFLNTKYKKRCLLQECPYPKHYERNNN